MQPLYFLPGLTLAALAPGGRLSQSLLAQRGLSDVFRDLTGPGTDIMASEPHGSPCGQAGVLLAYHTGSGEPPRRFGFYPAEQTWHAAAGEVWIGLDNASPPRPEELARRRLIPGFEATLGDGQRWAIPTLRRHDGSTELARDMFFDASGVLQQPLKERCRRDFDDFAVVAEWFFESEGFAAASFDPGAALTFAVRALSINYRYGQAEQAILRLVDSDNYLTVLGAVVDVNFYLAAIRAEAEKKTASADPPPEPGPPDD